MSTALRRSDGPRVVDAGLADVVVLSSLHTACFEDAWSPQSMGEVLRWVWDGRDEGGVVVPAGIYFYRVADRAGAMKEKVVRLR